MFFRLTLKFNTKIVISLHELLNFWRMDLLCYLSASLCCSLLLKSKLLILYLITHNIKIKKSSVAISNMYQSTRIAVCLWGYCVYLACSYVFRCSHQCIVIVEQCKPVSAVLLCHCVVALLFIDGISFSLGQAEEAANHAQVLPQGPVLRAGVLLPTQQFTQPALQEER